MYDNNCFPALWKTAIVVPVHKKGDVCDPSNYRGISLPSILGKIMLGVLNKRFLTWSDLNSFFADCQYGYRKNRSTIDSIFTIYTIVKSSFYKTPRKYVYCGMVDFLKAYDSVPRNVLFEKLLHFGISEKFVNMIKSIYSRNQAHVRCNDGNLTEAFDCPVGLRQGCVLSSTLFIAYLNDIESFFLSEGVGSFRLCEKRIILQLFADDLAILDSTVDGLQRKLNLLYRYCERWGLTINVKKTKILRFKSGRRSSSEKWHINGQSLDVVNHFEYLGLILSSSNSWCQAIENRVEKATKAMYVSLSNLKIFGRVPRKILLKIFDTQIASVLLYGCELWGLSDITQVEKVATKFYRMILCIPQNSSTDFARGELGRRSLKISIYKRVLSYWFKLLEADPDTAIHCAYQTLYQLAESNKDCWALRLRQLLFSIGFGEVWFNQGVGNVNYFMSEFKQRIIHMENSEWKDHVNIYGTLRTYRNLKESVSFEPYLDFNIPYKYIKLFTKLRGGLLPFESNSRRWSEAATNYEDRKCKLCNLNLVENEYHVIFVCPVWSCYRQQIQNDHEVFRTNNLKSVLTSEDPKAISSVGIFLERVIFEKNEILQIL